MPISVEVEAEKKPEYNAVFHGLGTLLVDPKMALVFKFLSNYARPQPVFHDNVHVLAFTG